MDKKLLKRTRFFISLLLLVFLLLCARLAYLQVIQYDSYWTRAEKNRLRILPITAPRGEIFDRNGEQIVTNRPGFTVSLVDLGDGYSDETIAYLTNLLHMEKGEIRDKIRSQYFRRWLPIRLKTDVSMQVVAAIAEKRMELPGVLIEVQPIRNYVYGNFSSHILGYLGEGTVAAWVEEYWQQHDDYRYRIGELVGQAGLEMAWEPFLRGIDGGIQVEINSTGQAIAEFERVDPQPGHDIYLTIDIPLQLAVERALVEAVERLVEGGNAYAGEAAAVVLDPQSGRILAIASIPSYDLNTFHRNFSVLEGDRRLRPLVNKAIEEAYPVGSTFKMVTALAALEEGVISPTGRVTCSGSLTRYGATKSCFRGTVHGPLNIVEAIAKSCNVFFYEMGLRVGIDSLAHYTREFGFGSPVGLTDIFGERRGVVASREYKREVYNEPFYPAETMDAAIGQSFQSITMLQLANHVSMIGNGGIHYRPYLVEKIVDSRGEVIKIGEPEILRQLEAQPVTWDTIQLGMIRAALPGGTAGRLADLPVSIAGKTGTAQAAGTGSSIPSHSLFVAYAPADHPEIALAVFVKHGGTGGTTAVPVARQILEQYFNVVPEAPEEDDVNL